MSLTRWTAVLLAASLTACGGGGGDEDGGGGTPPPAGGPFALSVSGTVTYDFVPHFLNGALDYAGTEVRPVRGASVELRAGSNAGACGAGALLAGPVATSATGTYSLSASTSGNVVVCVYTELVQTAGAGTPGFEFLVVDNTQNKAVYSLAAAPLSVTAATTTTQDLHAASGWSGSAYTATRAAAPFAILDVVYTALQKILSVDPDVDLPRLRLNWSVNNRAVDGNPANGAIGTSYFNVENDSNEIYILGDANNDTDEYDDHVVAHEFGHYMEQVLSRSDSLGGSHGGDDRLDLRVAYGEGFGNAWSGIVFDDPRYTDSFGSQQAQGFFIEVETDTTIAPGWFNETSVQAIIYDAYDSTNEAGDAVSLGLAPLYAVWTGAQRTTPAVTSIFPFLTALRAANPAAAAGLDALATGQSISGTDAWGAGETNSGGLGTDALPVYTLATPGGGTVQVCASNTNGIYNKLGNRRLLRVDIASAGSRRFQVRSAAGATPDDDAGDDPDAVLYLAGSEERRSEEFGNEDFTENLAAGTYVLEVYPWARTVNSGAAPGSYCMNITIT